MAISVTTLSTYLYCQRKLYLQKVLGLEELPKQAVVLGSMPEDKEWRMTSTLEKSDLLGKRIADIDFLDVYGGSWEKGWAIASCEITLEDGTVLDTDGQPWSVHAVRDKGE